jgi:hypothetical protein
VGDGVTTERELDQRIEEKAREIVEEMFATKLPKYIDRKFWSDLPPTDNYVVKFDASTAKLGFEAEAPAGAGSGTMTTVKDSGSQQGGDDIVTLDFTTGLTATESPDTEINISINESQIVHDSLSGGTSANAHHAETHTILSHDTNATGGQLNSLTDGVSNADSLHLHSTTGGGVTDHGALTGLSDDDHPQYRLVSTPINHVDLGLLDADDHPQYARQSLPETIAGEWTWSTYQQFFAVSAPSAPAEDHFRLQLITSGGNLILRGYGPTGDTCDICTVSNVVTAHTNTLTLNWIE